jgi:hypothetical protein
MRMNRWLVSASLTLAWGVLSTIDARAQSSLAVENIEKQLLQLYQTAKATADGTDLVTSGAVLVLQKDHLLMDKVDQPLPTPNVYKNGAIGQNGLGAVTLLKNLSKIPGLSTMAGNMVAGNATTVAAATREFVTGEKFWVTRIDTRPDGVMFFLMSDPIKEDRYHATLNFPFPKGSTPSADDVASTVSEVIKIDSNEGGGDEGGAAQGAHGQAAQQAGPAPAAPTKTIAIGQSRDQVVSMFGVPSKIVQLGPKEIDFFPDMKVTFVQNKVVDVK